MVRELVKMARLLAVHGCVGNELHDAQYNRCRERTSACSRALRVFLPSSYANGVPVSSGAYFDFGLTLISRVSRESHGAGRLITNKVS